MSGKGKECRSERKEGKSSEGQRNKGSIEILILMEGKLKQVGEGNVRVVETIRGKRYIIKT